MSLTSRRTAMQGSDTSLKRSSRSCGRSMFWSRRARTWWMQSAREELAIKQYNAGATEHEQRIVIEGGLPALPGTNVTMPVLDSRQVTNGHALEPPAPVAPSMPLIESPPNESVATTGQGPETKYPA